MKRLILALVLLWPVGAVADFAAGFAGAERGDYVTAIGAWRPIVRRENLRACMVIDFEKVSDDSSV